MANLIYANARAKSLAKNLLGKERLFRMVEAASAEDGLKILSEVNFGEGVYLESVVDFEKLISAEQNKLFAFLREESSPREVSEFFMLKNDFHNAEVYIKAKHLKKDLEHMTLPDGMIDKAQLKEKIFSDDYRDLPEFMAKALLFCDGEFVNGRADGSVVNTALTKGYFEELYKISLSDALLQKIFVFKVDCVNIGVALRSRNYSVAKELFLPHGKLSLDELKTLCEDGLENLKERFKFTEYKQAVAIASEEKLKGQPLREFERLADGYAQTLLAKERFSTAGNIIFLDYCVSKINELNNVRIVLVGLINGLDRADIKRKLRLSDER